MEFNRYIVTHWIAEVSMIPGKILELVTLKTDVVIHGFKVVVVSYEHLKAEVSRGGRHPTHP